MTQSPTLAQITAQLIELLHEQAGAAVTAETDLVNDLALASVQIMAFVTEVEDHFDIAIELESLASIHRLRELAVVVAAALDRS